MRIFKKRDCRAIRCPKWNGSGKYPGGAEAQRARLEAEGHTVIRRGRTNIRYYVQDYEDALFELE